MKDFRTKYRPEILEEVWGNEAVKLIWKGLKKKDSYPRSIVLCGEYGTGKTTLARILANDMAVDCGTLIKPSAFNYYEIDAPKHTCEYIQKFVSNCASYAHDRIVFFIDEVQRMTDRTQDTFLKSIEDFETVYFIFATTEKHKMDGGILSRSQIFNLSNPTSGILLEKLSEIAQKEKMNISRDALALLIEISNYNPRKCLGNLYTLSALEGAITKEKAGEILGDCTV